MSGPILLDRLYRAMVDAGVVCEGERIRRVVIDAQVGKPVMIHVERFADERLLDVVPSLVGAEVVYGSPAKAGDGA